ncbi:MAG: hypothetical protein ACUVT2_10810 [Thiobacillaceae bacterium]
MKAKTILSLSLTLLSVDVMAHTDYGVTPWGEALPQLAQMSAEERRLQQLRWERMTPEEQALLRQQLRERLMDLPPEQREFRRREIIEGWREQPTREREYRTRDTEMRRGFQTDDRHYQDDDAGRGFGLGFERRNAPRERPGRR